MIALCNTPHATITIVVSLIPSCPSFSPKWNGKKEGRELSAKASTLKLSSISLPLSISRTTTILIASLITLMGRKRERERERERERSSCNMTILFAWWSIKFEQTIVHYIETSLHGKGTRYVHHEISVRRRVRVPALWYIIYKFTVVQLTCHRITLRLSCTFAAWGSR